MKLIFLVIVVVGMVWIAAAISSDSGRSDDQFALAILWIVMGMTEAVVVSQLDGVNALA